MAAGAYSNIQSLKKSIITIVSDYVLTNITVRKEILNHEKVI